MFSDFKIDKPNILGHKRTLASDSIMQGHKAKPKKVSNFSIKTHIKPPQTHNIRRVLGKMLSKAANFLV